MTKGLRKVDKSEMTHKNPALRAGSVVPSTPGSPAARKWSIYGTSDYLLNSAYRCEEAYQAYETSEIDVEETFQICAGRKQMGYCEYLTLLMVNISPTFTTGISRERVWIGR